MLPRTLPWHPSALSIVIILLSFYNFPSVKSAGSSRASACDQWDVCSQICQETKGASNVTCSCLEEFHLGEDNRSCIPNDSTIKIVYALQNSIRISTLNRSRSGSNKVFENMGQTIGVAVDVGGGFAYWTVATEGKESVQRARVIGDGPIETVVDTGLQLPEGITFDWVTGNIYIADSNRSQIIVCRGDGAVCTVLVMQSTMDKPREIALHPSQGLMFWTDWGEQSSIMRASMDGSSSIAIVSEDIKWPNALAVDHGRNRLYWTDAYHDKIETSSLTGSDRQLVNMDNVDHPFSMEVFGDFIFWSDWNLKKIQSCTKFACKEDTRTIVEGRGLVNGIAIFHPAAQPRMRSNSCQNKCSHICVLSGKTGYSCKCPAGWKLDRGRKNCIDDASKPKMLIGHDDYLKVLRFDSIGRDVDVVEETKVPGLKSIGAMVYNPINDTVFVSDLTWKSIFEYSFTTRNLRTVSNSHLDSVKSMSFDPIGENLYWVDSSRRKVEVMSCRTGAIALIAHEAADYPQSIVVVPEERFLFVAVTGRRGGRILSMNMNGYNRRTLVRTNRGEPLSLTYNPELKHIFWIDSSKDSIEHASINGRSLATAERSGGPHGLTSFGNQIFWTDRYTQKMHTLAVFGLSRKESPIFIGHVDDKYTNGMVESYFRGNFYATLTIMHRELTIYENLTRHHDCSPSRATPKCSHICLFSAELDVGTCACPERMELKEDGRTCSWTTSCLKSQFQCDDKRCIDARWKCDGRPDCDGGEDERGCGAISICTGETDFMCESDKSCIHSKWKCDGERDCPNGEDEYNCQSGTHTCAPETEFMCNNGRCIPMAWKCDHQFDCPDGEEEISCNHTCPLGTFRCKQDMECISVEWVCDGHKDCKDGSDEDEHGHCVACSSDSFRCLDHHCIPGSLACNGVNDCADNSDEFECGGSPGIRSSTGSSIVVVERGPPEADDDEPLVEAESPTSRNGSSGISKGGSEGGLYETCPWDHYLCFTGECLRYTKVCDKSMDCADGSDEGPGCDLSCKENECPHQCVPTPGGSKCLCHPGFEQDERNKRGCVDINECAAGRPCDHICVNTRGSFKCLCHEEYALRSDKRRCKPKSKSVKPHYLNPADLVDGILSEKSRGGSSSESSRSGSSSAGWWVFGIFLILFLVGGVVGFVFHRKRIHPKVLFERYAHHIPVKFNIRRSEGRSRDQGSGAGDEETYQDFSDGRSSSDHAGLLSNIDASL